MTLGLVAAAGLVMVGLNQYRRSRRRGREWIDPIIVRKYEGAARTETADSLAADAEVLAAQGYHVLEQSWDEPKRTGLAATMFGGYLPQRTGTLTVVFKRDPTSPRVGSG